MKNHLSGAVERTIQCIHKKTVEDVKLVHKNNQILLPQSKQQNVLDWYHKVLIYPSEARMIETITLVFTWSGSNKQVKVLVKTCREC